MASAAPAALSRAYGAAALVGVMASRGARRQAKLVNNGGVSMIVAACGNDVAKTCRHGASSRVVAAGMAQRDRRMMAGKTDDGELFGVRRMARRAMVNDGRRLCLRQAYSSCGGA